MLALAYFVALVAADACFTEHCADATCGLAFPFPTDSGATCDQSSLGYHISACDPLTQTRSVAYYWRPPAVCRGSLPNPTTIPCDVECSYGQIYNAASGTCENCSAGTAVLDMARQWSTWTSFPDEFTTYCFTRSGQRCNAWEVEDNYIRSGANPDILDITRSVLQLRVSTEHSDAFFSYTYTVDSEYMYDGLRVFVDDLIVAAHNGTANGTVNIPLSKGYHTIEWEYKKDEVTNIGADRATISAISVYGLTGVPLRCLECPAGYYQDRSGQVSCIPCPVGFYAPEVSSTQCLECPDGHSSFAGSASCFEQRDCDENDLGHMYSSCNAETGKMTKSYFLLQPATCNARVFTLPEPEEVECTVATTCRAGEFRNDNGDCEACPYDYVSDGTKVSACNPCKTGTTAGKRTMYFDDWSKWPQGFNTLCTGECATDGWRLGGDFVDSGSHHGANALSILAYDGVFEYGTTVSFKYTFVVPNADCPKAFLMVISGQDSLLNLDTDSAAINTPTEVSFTTYKSVSELRFVFKTNPTGALVHETSIRISDLKITGLADYGGSAECVNCSRGYYGYDHNGVGKCAECPQGTYSESGWRVCMKCPANTFSNQKTDECMDCGLGTFSEAGATICTIPYTDIKLADFVPEETELTKEEIDLTTFSLDWTGNAPHNLGRYIVNFSFDQPIDCGNLSFGYVCIGEISPLDDSYRTYTGDLIQFGSMGRDGFYAGFVSTAKQAQILSVAFQCDPTSTEDSVSLTTQPGFQRAMVWRSRNACRFCVEEDILETTGSCNGTALEVSYSWKTTMCKEGRVKLPATKTQECVMEIEMQTNALVIILSLAGAILVALAALAIVLWYRHRRLHIRYKRLQLGEDDDLDDE